MRPGAITGVLVLVLVAAPLTSIGGVQASGPGWTISPTTNPTMNGGQLTGVSCPTVTDCMAVGLYTDPAGNQVTLAEQWSGSTWSIENTPRPSGQVSALEGVACPASSDCTAVGYAYNDAGVRITLAEHWNGTAWAIETTPGPAGAGATAFAGVSCATTSSCTAVGSSVTGEGTLVTLAEQWNGISWSIETTPNPAGAVSSSFTAVSCTSPGVCSAVGSSTSTPGLTGANLAEQSSGATWTMETTPTSFDGPLAGVSCTEQNFCVGVGVHNITPETETWNGVRWRMEPNSLGRGSFSSVSCTALNACTAAGTAVARLSVIPVWTAQAMAPPGGTEIRVSSVSCANATACTMVGSDYRNARFQPFVERWNGTSWSTESVPSPAAAAYLSSLQSVSCASSAQCMAVGYTTNSSGGAVPLAERWMGASWTKGAIPSPGSGTTFNRLDGVSCATADMCMAVGLADDANGTFAERWNGAAWTIEPIAGPGLSLLSVSCVSSTACVAVGNTYAGTLQVAAVAQWNGTTWSVQTLSPPAGSEDAQLLGVSCVSINSCVAVGNSISATAFHPEFTLAEQWNGIAWSQVSTPSPSPIDSELAAVSCTTPSECTAVGDDNQASLAEQWNGSVWTVEATPTPVVPAGTTYEYVLLRGVTCSAADVCTAVGSYVSGGQYITYPASTLVDVWNGAAWTEQSSPNPTGTNSSQFASVSCSAGGACMAVGTNSNTSTYSVTLAERYTP